MKTVEKNCETCGKSFSVRFTEVQRGNGKYCSRTCSAKAPKSLKFEHICKHCGEKFKSASKASKYCSNSCKQKNYRLKSKGDVNMKKFYKIFENIPCELCNWDKSSRDLHHIVEVSNGGKNELDNLLNVCPNCHRMIHNNLISKDTLLKSIQTRTISSSSKA